MHSISMAQLAETPATGVSSSEVLVLEVYRKGLVILYYLQNEFLVYGLGIRSLRH